MSRKTIFSTPCQVLIQPKRKLFYGDYSRLNYDGHIHFHQLFPPKIDISTGCFPPKIDN